MNTKYIPIFFSKIKENSNLNKIVKNIFWLFFDKILKLGLGLFVMILLSRHLKPEDFGLMNYIVSLISLFIAFSALGLNAIIVRDLIEKPDHFKTLGTTFLLRIIGSVFFYILLIITIYILRPDDDLSQYLVALLGLSLFFKSSDVIRYWYESKIESKNVVLIENCVYVLLAIIKLILIYNDATLVHFVYILLFESILIFFFLFLFYIKHNNLRKWRFNVFRSRELLKDSWPLIISSASWIIYSKTDQIMIGQLLGNEQVGFYAAASQLSVISSFIPSVIAFSIIPSILKYKKTNRKLYNSRFQLIYNTVTTILFLTAIIVNIFSPEIVSLLYGELYSPASEVLRIQFWIVIFIGLAVVSGRYLVNDNLQKITMQRHVLGALINIPLNYFLILKMGITGAAWSSLFTLITVNYFFDFAQSKTRFIFKQKTNAIFFVWVFSLLKKTDLKSNKLN
jgi:O-antigen/teichoic acid export membrane protein